MRAGGGCFLQGTWGMMHLQGTAALSLKDAELCQGARQGQSRLPSRQGPCSAPGTRAKASSCPGAARQPPPPFREPAMASGPGPAGHATLEVPPPLIGSVVWQSNLIGEN